jgi:hypothetical protein
MENDNDKKKKILIENFNPKNFIDKDDELKNGEEILMVQRMMEVHNIFKESFSCWKCHYCNGIGHNIENCATLANIDKLLEDHFIWKSVWTKYRSLILSPFYNLDNDGFLIPFVNKNKD